MSRIGKKPVEIPDKVEVLIEDNNKVSVKGPLGELSEKIRPEVKIVIDSFGNFDYKVLLFSSSEIFNKELLEYLEYLKTKNFPLPKEAKREIVVYFEAKE